MIYGYPATLERYKKRWLCARTPVPNLYLTGVDAGILGVMGAMMGGVVTASCLLGPLGFFEVIRRAKSG